MLGDAGSMLWTALHSAVDTATFGLQNKASAMMAHLISPVTGKPLTYDEALGRIQANQAADAARNPVSALVGDIGGMAIGAGKLAELAKAGEAIPGVGKIISAVAPEAGQPIRNVAKAALTSGAAAGGYTAVDDLARTGTIDPDNVVVNTAVGMAVGPAVTKVGTALANGIQNASTRAIKVLADKLEETPEVLQKVYDNFKAATGRLPTMAELVGMKSQGELRQLASNSPTIQAGVNNAADTAAAQRSRTLSQIVEDNSGGQTQDINQLTQARKERMDAAMAPLKKQRVDVGTPDMDVLTDPRVLAAVRATKIPELRTKLGNVVNDVDEYGASNKLTLDDVDSIRKAVRQQQTNMLNPQSTAHNAQGAQSMGELADKLTQMAAGGDAAHPYAQALQQFEQDSHYIKGFKHGYAGKTIGEASSPDLINSLNEAEGRAGHEAGITSRVAEMAAASPDSATRTADMLANNAGDSANLRVAVGEQKFGTVQRAAQAESKGAEAMRNITGRVGPEETPFSGREAAQTVAAAASHSPAGLMFHAARAIPSFAKLPGAVQKQIVRYLADPAMTQQGINLLRKAGAREQEIRRLAVALSASAGANTASTMGQ